LKEAKNEAEQEAIFTTIMKGDHMTFPKQNVKTPVIKMTPDDNSNVTGLLRNLEKRMEKTEKRMENLQSQVNTIEKNIDFFCKEMVRYQGLFQDVSKILGKFVDNM
jgi:tetrahydromethanopterin S-methyltransferase subunit G